MFSMFNILFVVIEVKAFILAGKCVCACVCVHARVCVSEREDAYSGF